VSQFAPGRLAAVEHPGWCDVSRCDAVVGEEAPDYAGAHRSAVTKVSGAFGGLEIQLCQVSLPRPPLTFIVFSAGEDREWAAPVGEVAPGVLELLAGDVDAAPPGVVAAAVPAVAAVGGEAELVVTPPTGSAEPAPRSIVDGLPAGSSGAAVPVGDAAAGVLAPGAGSGDRGPAGQPPAGPTGRLS
jgi:hypothetical protein